MVGNGVAEFGQDDAVGRLPWLADAEVIYRGDIDTHGFDILDRLRGWLPQARSVLTDRETLVAHRDRWGTGDRPARPVLTRLSPEEADLYTELVGDGLGESGCGWSRSGSTGSGSLGGCDASCGRGDVAVPIDRPPTKWPQWIPKYQ